MDGLRFDSDGTWDESPLPSSSAYSEGPMAQGPAASFPPDDSNNSTDEPDSGPEVNEG